MQFVDGVTLRSQIRPEGMPLERVAEIIKQIGRALTAAHDRGIFHRDLKPENIMLQSFGRGEEQVKIIDFGIAKLKDSLVAPSTLTGPTAGTVAYMSPEQLTGQTVSAATDIYAMGVIAYELVTGRKPFNPETGFELLEMQRAGVRVKPSDLRPSLSSEADEIILRALSFDPQQRFPGARELGDLLSRALTEETAPFELRAAAPGMFPQPNWQRTQIHRRDLPASLGQEPSRHRLRLRKSTRSRNHRLPALQSKSRGLRGHG